MKNLRSVLLCLMTTMNAYSVEPFSHSATGITLPDTLAGLNRGVTQSYEAAPGESGFAVPFQGTDVEATVFIRKMAAGSNATAKSLVDETLESVKQLEKSGVYSNVKIFSGKQDGAQSEWQKAAYMAQTEGRVLISFVYITIKNGHSIKVRLTTTNPKCESVHKFADEFQVLVDAAKPQG